MASKTYMAQEMREMEKNIVRVDVMDGLTCREHCYPMEQVVRSMLRQAADALEREKEREKKYQYEVWYTAKDGGARRSSERAISLDSAKRILSMFNEFSDAHIVRREVGEWEEVKDGE